MYKYLIYLLFIGIVFLNACADVEENDGNHFSIDSLSISPNEKLLSDDIVKMAYGYYKQPYLDAPNDFTQGTFDKKVYKVFRPNHGLLHGLRKAALAINAAITLSNTNSTLAPWLNASTDPNSIAYNPNFLQQLAFGLLMLRTGRGSEKNEKYKEYSYKSAEYFLYEAKKSGIFPRQKDIDDFAFAFQTIGDLPKCFDLVNNLYIYTQARGCTLDRLNLYNFIYGVHHLDLRRMVAFTKADIIASIASYFGLFTKDNNPDVNADAIKKLWQLSGEYLRVTGDRDMDGTPPNHRLYKKPFYLLSNNPIEARKKVEEVFRSSLPSIAPQPTAKAPPAPESPVVKAPTLMPVAEKKPGEIQVIISEAKPTDIWFNYRARPLLTEASKTYPSDILSKAKSLRMAPGTHMPWTFKAVPEKNKGLFKLADVVPDRIYEKASNKHFVKMYHGTTSDLFDTFKSGAPIRFDLGKGALGTGFYLTADVNEAMYYACERLKARKPTNKELKGMLLVYGIEINNSIKGKYSPNIPLSDENTGETLDKEIYFKRNGNLYNQFLLFKNAEPFLKLFAIVLLPDGFSKSKGINDLDGLPKKTTPLVLSEEFYCDA